MPPGQPPDDPAIEVVGAVVGAVVEPLAVPLTDLVTLPRQEITADFHCVAGWSATDLHWAGVAFETFYRTVLEPRARPGATVTHSVFGGLDRYRAAVLLEDALAGDVLVADHLDGRPLVRYTLGSS